MEINPLAALSDRLADTVSKASGSTVAVLQDGVFVSSGVIWKPGLIVTTDHSIKKAQKLEAILPSGERRTVSMKGRASGTDIAVLECSGINAESTLERGDVTAVRTGQLMLVTGRSLDTGVNATMGVVSAVSGSWRTWRGGQMDSFIRLDVALFPGVNGGVVLNANGQAVGVATPALSRIAGVVIPAPTVDAAIERILTGRKSGNPGYLGVGLHEVDYNGKHYPIILSVMPGGAAERGGLMVGDLIRSMWGRELKGVRDIWTELMEPASAGRETEVEVIRGGQPVKVKITVGERPHKGTEEEQESEEE